MRLVGSMRLFLAASLFFLLIYLYTEFRLRQQRTESFQNLQGMNPNQIMEFVKKIQLASGQLGQEKVYDKWVGWIYTHSTEKSSLDALNDFKSRVFKDSCLFRMDWNKNIPPGLTIPMAADNKDLANMAYQSYMRCLAMGNPLCIQQLDDFKRRFMMPDCEFKYQSNKDAYTKNLGPVF
jgi:predicted DNA-binding transcriptional regulator